MMLYVILGGLLWLLCGEQALGFQRRIKVISQATTVAQENKKSNNGDKVQGGGC